MMTQLRFGLIVNIRRPKASIVPGLVRYLHRQGHIVFTDRATARALSLDCKFCSEQRLAANSDVILALGGDGTLLRAAHLIGASDIPIIGINLGQLGFLTEFTYRQARQAIADYIAGRCREERRMVLQATLMPHSAPETSKQGVRKRGAPGGRFLSGYYALNDVSVNMGQSCRAIQIILSVNGTYVTHFTADGVVIATPTGSTAYSLSAGGPIVFPTLEAILITPLSPHALSARPLIAAPGEIIGIRLSARNPEPAALVVDGRRCGELVPGQELRLQRAEHKIRLITPRRRSYYQILRSKMKWGGRQDAEIPPDSELCPD